MIRMKKLGARTALWMVLMTTALSAGASAMERSASVHYTYFNKSLRGFRVGDECYVPLQSLSEIGWTASSTTGIAKLVAENRSFTLPTKSIDQKPHIPFRKAIEKLGGSSLWIPGGFDSLEVCSPVTRIHARNGKISFDATMSVKPTITLFGPNKVVIDIEGGKLSKQAKLEVDRSIMVEQYRPDTVRITYPLSFGQGLPTQPASAGRTFDFDFSKVTSDSGAGIGLKPTESPRGDDLASNRNNKFIPKDDEVPAQPPKKPETANPETPKPETPKPEAPKPQSNRPITNPIEIPLPLSVLGEGKDNVDMALKFPRGFFNAKATAKKISPDTIEILLPGTRCFIPKIINYKTSFVTEFETTYDQDTTVLRLKTKTEMNVSVESAQDLVYISLSEGTSETPTYFSGDLRGKTIYLDPGHGGNDRGAGYAGAFESKIVMLHCAAIEKALQGAGAKVIVSRRTDVYRTVLERPREANSIGADLFISVHVNQVEPKYYIKNKKPFPTGSITFYHEGRAKDRELATLIQSELSDKKLLPSWGIRSDYTIYPGEGFGVLRLAKMPAVLIETGFIIHPKDREVIQTQAFADGLAKSVLDGILKYYSK